MRGAPFLATGYGGDPVGKRAHLAVAKAIAAGMLTRGPCEELTATG